MQNTALMLDADRAMVKSMRPMLHQIAHARVPQTNAQTALVYSSKQTFISSHNGADIDYFEKLPTPLSRGALQHTGKFSRPTFNPFSRTDETSALRSMIGMTVPFLFYMPVTAPIALMADSHMYGDDGYLANDLRTYPYQAGIAQQVPQVGSVLWFYGWGKLVSVQTPTNVEDFRDGGIGGQDVAIGAEMTTPLRLVKRSTWRYGEMVPVDDPAAWTIGSVKEVEYYFQESAVQWWVPGNVPRVDDRLRFWPRDLEMWKKYPDNYFDWSTQLPSADYYMYLKGPEQQNPPYQPTYVRPPRPVYLPPVGAEYHAGTSLRIPGETQPFVRWLVGYGDQSTPTNEVTIVIRNAIGTRTYTYKPVVKTAATYYMDTDLGLGWRSQYGIIVADPLISRPPILLPGDNHIQVVSGYWQLAMEYQWL